MKRKIVLMLVVVLCMLCGCGKNVKITTGLSKDEIFKFADETVPLNEMLLVLVNEKNQYEESLGSDVWSRTFGENSLEEEIKEKVKNQMIELTAIAQMAEENKTQLTEEEESLLKQAASEYVNSLEEEEKNAIGATEETVYDFYKKMYLSDKYYELKTSENEKEISDEEAKVIEVMYIYFKTGEKDIYGNVQPYEESKKAEVLATAQSVLEQVRQGADFQSLAGVYSDDTEYRSTFGRGVMEEAFEQAAFSLSSGETSELVQTESGYYIIKCVDDYLETSTEENKQNMKEKYKAEQFKEIYQPFLDKQELEFNRKVWEEISIHDYAQCKSKTIYDVYNQYV